jgi:hypothetical protein
MEDQATQRTDPKLSKRVKFECPCAESEKGDTRDYVICTYFIFVMSEFQRCI